MQKCGPPVWDNYSDEWYQNYSLQNGDIREGITKCLIEKSVMYSFENKKRSYSSHQEVFERLLFAKNVSINNYALSLSDEVFNQYLTDGILLKVLNDSPINKRLINRIIQAKTQSHPSFCLMTMLFIPEHNRNVLLEAY
jgi:hypothetical protein